MLRRVALVLTLVCLSARLADARQAEPAPAAASPAAAPVAAPAIDAAAFASFIEDVRQDALKRGISKATLDSAFRDVQPEPTALERDRQQAEFALDLQAYLRRRLTKDTLKQARRVWHENHSLATRVGTASRTGGMTCEPSSMEMLMLRWEGASTARAPCRRWRRRQR